MHELLLNVVIIVCKLILLVSVAIEKIVQLVHLKGLVLQGDFELPDSLIVSFYLIVESKLLLVKDRLFGQEIIIITCNFRIGLLFLNKLNLILNPFLLDLSDFFVNLLDLLRNAVTLVFKGTSVLITISASFQIGALSVQSVDTELLLLDFNVTLLDVSFD